MAAWRARSRGKPYIKGTMANYYNNRQQSIKQLQHPTGHLDIFLAKRQSLLVLNKVNRVKDTSFKNKKPSSESIMPLVQVKISA